MGAGPLIAANAVAQVAALGGILVVQTAYMVFAARLLGVEDFGRFSFLFSITQILLMAGDLGLHNTALRRISSASSQSPRVFPLFLSLKFALSLVLFAICAVIAFLLPASRDLSYSLFFFGAGLAFHSTGLSLNVGFQAHGKLYLASICSLLLVLFNAAFGTSGLLLGGRIIWLGIAYLLASALTLAMSTYLFHSRIHRVALASLRGGWHFLKESLPIGLGTLFEQATSRLPLTLLLYLAGSYDTGLYSAALRILAALRNLPVAIMGAVLPAMASHQKDARRVALLFRPSLLAMIGLSVPLNLALFFGADWLVRFLYGSEFQGAADSLRILSCGVVPAFVALVLMQIILSQNHLVRRFPLVTGTGLIVNLLCNLLLIPRLGDTGAAFSGVITEILLVILLAAGIRRFFRSSSTGKDSTGPGAGAESI